MKKNWPRQPQQHSTSDTDVPSPLNKEVEREHWVGAQDITDHTTEANRATRKLEQTASHMETDALLTKEVITDTFSQAEAVKEEIAEIRKRVKESKLVRTKYVFVKTWRRRT